MPQLYAGRRLRAGQVSGHAIHQITISTWPYGLRNSPNVLAPAAQHVAVALEALFGSPTWPSASITVGGMVFPNPG
jgi:hypothetical protein